MCKQRDSMSLKNMRISALCLIGQIRVGFADYGDFSTLYLYASLVTDQASCFALSTPLPSEVSLQLSSSTDKFMGHREYKFRWLTR